MKKYITLEFSDDTSANCEILGHITVEDRDYVVLLADDRDKSVYIYRYTVKKGKYRLEHIKKKDEFDLVCSELNRLVKKPK